MTVQSQSLTGSVAQYEGNQIPRLGDIRGMETTMGNEPFVANDGGRWFVMQNIDHEDLDGNMGMSTEYLCSPHGYDTEADADAALASLVGA